ncbi:MAG: hypothetical protein JWR10_4725 [Rubritepida sp.]|nr:hypothetical protein [Rubritepida sp.]
MHHFLIPAALTLLALPAIAAPEQSRLGSIASNCQAACLEQTTHIGRPAPVQACRIRCDATRSFSRNDGRGRAVASASRSRPAAPAAAPAAVAPVAAAPAAAAPVASPHGFSVIYAARTPSAGFGMEVGNTDRLVAYRVAEQRCSSAGPGCRIIAEFTDVCGAVAQGVRRSEGAFIMTSDPATYVITSMTGGSAGTREDAESDAMAECGAQDHLATCRVVAAQCGTRS